MNYLTDAEFLSSTVLLYESHFKCYGFSTCQVHLALLWHLAPCWRTWLKPLQMGLLGWIQYPSTWFICKLHSHRICPYLKGPCPGTCQETHRAWPCLASGVGQCRGSFAQVHPNCLEGAFEECIKAVQKSCTSFWFCLEPLAYKSRICFWFSLFFESYTFQKKQWKWWPNQQHQESPNIASYVWRECWDCSPPIPEAKWHAEAPPCPGTMAASWWNAPRGCCLWDVSYFLEALSQGTSFACDFFRGVYWSNWTRSYNPYYVAWWWWQDCKKTTVGSI